MQKGRQRRPSSERGASTCQLGGLDLVHYQTSGASTTLQNPGFSLSGLYDLFLVYLLHVVALANAGKSLLHQSDMLLFEVSAVICMSCCGSDHHVMEFRECFFARVFSRERLVVELVSTLF